MAETMTTIIDATGTHLVSKSVADAMEDAYFAGSTPIRHEALGDALPAADQGPATAPPATPAPDPVDTYEPADGSDGNVDLSARMRKFVESLGQFVARPHPVAAGPEDRAPSADTGAGIPATPPPSSDDSAKWQAAIDRSNRDIAWYDGHGTLDERGVNAGLTASLDERVHLMAQQAQGAAPPSTIGGADDPLVR